MKYFNRTFSVPSSGLFPAEVWWERVPGRVSKGEWVQVGNKQRWYPEGKEIPVELATVPHTPSYSGVTMPIVYLCGSDFEGHTCRLERRHKGPHQCYECDQIRWINGAYL